MLFLSLVACPLYLSKEDYDIKNGFNLNSDVYLGNLLIFGNGN